MNWRQAKTSKGKYLSSVVFEPATFRTKLKAIILNRSATLTGYVLCLKVLHDDDIWIKPIGDNTCAKFIMVRCLFKLTQRKSAFLLQMYPILLA